MIMLSRLRSLVGSLVRVFRIPLSLVVILLSSLYFHCEKQSNSKARFRFLLKKRTKKRLAVVVVVLDWCTMLRFCGALLAADFKQKSRWTRVRPMMSYGAMYLPYGMPRTRPFKGVNWVTRDSNRLTNFQQRYGSVLADFDAEKNETELKVPLMDVRWNDHRRLYWKCATCGEPYRRQVTSKIKFHANCKACRNRFPSEVRGDQSALGTRLADVPELAKQLAGEAEHVKAIQQFDVTSKFNARWTCRACKKEYRATVRQRTHKVLEGQAQPHPASAAWASVCPQCSWATVLHPTGRQAAKSGQLLGLESALTQNETACSSAPPVPRRKRVTVC